MNEPFYDSADMWEAYQEGYRYVVDRLDIEDGEPWFPELDPDNFGSWIEDFDLERNEVIP